jgi:hypothetical protein
MSGDQTSDVKQSVADWENLPRDPDLERDLGYQIEDWEVVTARAAGAERLLFIPSDESVLCDDEFIVADPTIVSNVADRR